MAHNRPRVTRPGLRRSRSLRTSSAPTATSLRKYRSPAADDTRAAAKSAVGPVHRLAATTSRQSCSDNNGGTSVARRCSTRTGASAARSGTPHGPLNSSTATTPAFAPGRLAATARSDAASAASARGSNCRDRTGRWDETSRTAPEPASAKAASPAPDSASVSVAKAGRSARTAPDADTSNTIATASDN